MENEVATTSTFWLKDYQTLIAGLSAIGAAVISGYFLHRGQKQADKHFQQQIEEERRRESDEREQRRNFALVSLRQAALDVDKVCDGITGAWLLSEDATEAIARDIDRSAFILPNIDKNQFWDAIVDCPIEIRSAAEDLRSNVFRYNYWVRYARDTGTRWTDSAHLHHHTIEDIKNDASILLHYIEEEFGPFNIDDLKRHANG